MIDLTPDRLQELRRIAEAATPGPYGVVGLSGCGGPYALRMPHRSGKPWYGVEGIKRSKDAEYFVACDPDTVLALLDEIERLRREREVMVEVLKAVHERDMHIHTCDHCECTLCPEGTELSYKAYITQWIYSKGGVGA